MVTPVGKGFDVDQEYKVTVANVDYSLAIPTINVSSANINADYDVMLKTINSVDVTLTFSCPGQTMIVEMMVDGNGGDAKWKRVDNAGNPSLSATFGHGSSLIKNDIPADSAGVKRVHFRARVITGSGSSSSDQTSIPSNEVEIVIPKQSTKNALFCIDKKVSGSVFNTFVIHAVPYGEYVADNYGVEIAVDGGVYGDKKTVNTSTTASYYLNPTSKYN
ncbi:MAG: hypothetical protein KKA19_01380, partial [Candidatus Margulisbacteria bacterium]|nr:hypothetical protein [Candidatus Margulisiibacteriota bacterium]